MKRIVISMIIITGMAAIAIILLNADSDEAIERMNENELRQFEQNLEDGLMIEIGERLYNENYSFGLEWEALSKDEVKITFKIPKKDNSSEFENEIKRITNEVVEASNFNSVTFKTNIIEL